MFCRKQQLRRHTVNRLTDLDLSFTARDTCDCVHRLHGTRGRVLLRRYDFPHHRTGNTIGVDRYTDKGQLTAPVEKEKHRFSVLVSLAKQVRLHICVAVPRNVSAECSYIPLRGIGAVSYLSVEYRFSLEIGVFLRIGGKIIVAVFDRHVDIDRRRTDRLLLYLLTELTQAYRRSGDVEATLQTLGDILMDRLSGLSGAALQVAELISLFSEEVPSRLLLELMDQNDRLLTAGLDELRGRGIILEHHTEGDPTYRFAHQRIRELVYDRLSYSQRQPLHLQAAELLSQGEQPQEGGACRQIARHFQLAGSRLRALEYRIRACDLDSSRAFEPFSPLGGDAPAPRSPEELEEQTQQFLRELSALRREGADPAVLGRLELATALIQGRIALFQGDSARGSDILGALSGGSIHPDTGVLIRACYLLASSALYRQATEQVERYTATGMRLLERTRDPVQQAQFQRLRGGLFCLQGAYDKSRYYLLEAMDALRGQPRSTAVRLQLAAVYCDYGRVCRQRLEYADACSYYKRALSLLGDLPWPGGVWVYVHYGRAAFALEDHPRARELFQHGYDNAKVSGELWGRTAASAYTAYYQAMEGDYERAAVSLADAQSCQQRLNSPLEGVILHFVSMHIRSRLDLEQRTGSPLAPLLTYSPESYARQGVRLLSSVPSVFEAEQLSQSLRNGIATQQRYRASELYSKNKHFMAE